MENIEICHPRASALKRGPTVMRDWAWDLRSPSFLDLGLMRARSLVGELGKKKKGEGVYKKNAP